MEVTGAGFTDYGGVPNVINHTASTRYESKPTDA